MGEAQCSQSCAGRLFVRQPFVTVLVVQEVPHHRHQRHRHPHQPKKQRLLPTLNWQMSTVPMTKSENYLHQTLELNHNMPIKEQLHRPRTRAKSLTRNQTAPTIWSTIKYTQFIK